MEFEQNKSIENFGKKVGFLYSYFLFTTILFLVLTLLGKIPTTWNYINIMTITLILTLLSKFVKNKLK